MVCAKHRYMSFDEARSDLPYRQNYYKKKLYINVCYDGCCSTGELRVVFHLQTKKPWGKTANLILRNIDPTPLILRDMEEINRKRNRRKKDRQRRNKKIRARAPIAAWENEGGSWAE